MPTTSLKEQVLPEHGALREIFGASVCRDASQLQTTLEALFGKFIYQPVRGRTSLEDLASRQQKAEALGRRASINCYDFSCLVVSHLRASQWRHDEVFVAPCDVLDGQGGTAEHFHCCVLLRRGKLQLIDPSHFDQRVEGKDAILRRYRFHMLFNDQRLAASKDEKLKLLHPLPTEMGLSCYLYGTSSPALQKLIARDSFKALAKQLFQPRESPGSVEGESSVSREPSAQTDSDVLEEAKRFELFEPGAEGLRPGRCLVALSREVEQTLREVLDPRLASYVAIVEEASTHLRSHFSASAMAEDYSWLDVEHSLVAGTLMDLAVGNRLAVAANVKETHGESVIWCFENLQVRNAFGVHLFATEDSSFLFQLWHQTVRRPRLSLSKRFIPLLRQYLEGDREALGVQEWQYLRFLKLATGTRDRGALRMPVIASSETPGWAHVLLKAADRLAAEVFVPAFEAIEAEPAWRGLRRGESQGLRSAHGRPAVARAMLDYATDRLVDEGVLSPFPCGTPPVAWGRVLWLEGDSTEGPLVPWASFQTSDQGKAVSVAR